MIGFSERKSRATGASRHHGAQWAKKLGQAVLLVLLGVAISPQSAHAAAGDLDPSFDFDGIVTTAMGNPNDFGRAIAVQSDGKIVVAGYSGTSTTRNDFAVARYNSNGTLDTTFNTTGKVVTPVGSGNDQAFAVAIDGNGKIVLAGTSSNGINNDFAVVRYTSTGALDTTFNGTGKVTTPIGSSHDLAQAVAIDGSGNIIAAGYSSNGVNNDFAVVRYTSTGGLDTTFNGTGMVTTPIGSSHDTANAMAIDGNSKIVVAGYSSNGSNNDFAVVRYTSTGALDTTFNGTGKVTTAIGPGHDVINAIAIDGNGKIVTAGSSNNGVDNDFALVRYTSTGGLDTTFNTTGKVTTAVGSGADAANAVTINGSNIIAAGSSSNGTDNDFALVRYTSTGGLDTTFNTTGKVTTPIGSGADVAYAVAVDSNSKIVAAGSSNNGVSDDFAMVRYTSTGALDTTFNGTGILTTPLDYSPDHGQAVAVQSDGKIVVVGDCYNGIDYDFAVVRYNSNGSLDTTFNGTGKVTTAVGTGIDQAFAVAIDGNGKIVVAGCSRNGSVNNDFAVVRYNSNGGLDTTFNGTGKVTTELGSSSDDVAAAVAIDANGKIILAGYSATGSTYDFAVVRYTSTGALDTTFNGTGKVFTGIGSSHDTASAMKIDGNGKIVVAGSSDNGIDYDFAVVRYNSNGSLDTTFNTTGKVTTAVGPGNDYAQGMAIDGNGKIVVVGQVYTSSNCNGCPSNIGVVRYNSNGSLDTTFNTTGKITTALGFSSAATDVAIDANGKVVVVGYSANLPTNDFAVVRYTSTGALDTTFNGTGTVTTAIGVSDEFAMAVALDANDNIIAAGSSRIGSSDDFAVVRYDGGNGSSVVAPTIISFTPTRGPIGTSVVITGTDFTGATNVTFNGTAATFNVDSATQITATVPTGATTGLISVTTPGGTVNSAAATTPNFTVTETPSLIVTTTADSISDTDFLTSLREAITYANSHTGADIISFNIAETDSGYNATTGKWTIAPATALPTIDNANGGDGAATTINGYTQTGASANTLATGSNNAVVKIELRPTGTRTIDGLTISAADCVVKGLSITNSRYGILLNGAAATRTLISGNYIGLRADGTTAGANDTGILINGTASNTIGGTTAGARNVVSGNTNYGVQIDGSGATGNTVSGNYIGVAADGTTVRANARGVTINAANNTIGGSSAAAGNVISGNTMYGVQVEGSSSIGNSIRFNSIYDNGTTVAQLGINLWGPADTNLATVTANDNDDSDNLAPNNLQNFPVLTTLATSGGNSTISGTLNSTPGKSYVIDFYDNAAADTSLYGEGKTYLGSTNVTTDINGDTTFSQLLTGVTLTNGHYISATATRTSISDSTGALGDSSEFSFAKQYVANSAPVTVADGYNGTEDTTLTVAAAQGVLINDTDVDGDTLTAVLLNAPSTGNLTLNSDGSFTYIPVANANGDFTFTYKANDGTADGNVVTVTLHFAAVNDKPVATNKNIAAFNEDVLKTVALAGTDIEGDGLSFKVTSLAANGQLYDGNSTSGHEIITADLPYTITDSASRVTYAPNADYNGSDSFKYRANDGTADSVAEATINLTVTPVNDAPGFTKGANQSVAPSAGARSISGWATAISAGPANESGQTVDFIVSNDNNALFTVQPAISADGTLTYTPAGTLGTATVSVQIHDNGGTTNNGVDTSAVQTFTITVTDSAPPPVIDDFDPDFAPPGRTGIDIYGSNFTGATSVKFNGVSAAFTIVTDTQITATVPEEATTGKISVTNDIGTGTSTADFRVTPRVDSFTPTAGPVGTVISITGKAFAGAIKVRFAAANNTTIGKVPTNVTATSLQVVVPNGALTGRLTVVTPSGSGKSASNFTVTGSAPPAITSFAPTSGPKGSTLYVYGSGFTGATAVKFIASPGGTLVSAGFKVLSDVKLKVTVPSALPTTPTTWLISVTCPGGTDDTSTLDTPVFTITRNPLINSFTPESGVVDTEVSISGVNLGNATDVQFSAAGGTWISTGFFVNSSTSLTTFVPNGAVTGKIRVLNPYGSGLSSSNFTVVPELLDFTPKTGPVGTTITISGRSLDNVIRVKINGLGCGAKGTGWFLDSPTQIRVIVPTGATTGRVTIVYALNGINTNVTSTSDFTVTP